jgi:predicted TIM-barrel fold metal-dependent hydrolase
MNNRPFALAWALCALTQAHALAQMPIDSALATYIAGIRAIDNHAHPLRYVAPGAPADTEYDALPLDGIPAFPLPWRFRGESPEWAAASRTLFGLPATAADAELKAARTRTAAQQGAHFAEWVLDRVGTDVMLANRIVLGAGLASPRFLWVPFADPLMLPFDTRAEAARTPDTRSLYPKEAALLRRYLRDLGLSALPATLDAYVSNVVRPTLEREKQGGAVAVKFEAAYLRPLDFANPSAAAARAVYARYVKGGAPTHAEYKTLEDYLFRAIAREAGKLGLAVHVHVFDNFGGFYDANGSQPALLEPVFNDSTLRATNFVIIHGGWPHVGQTASMMGKPNVYADISMMVLALPPSQVAAALRQWLVEWPEKVLFGTDAFDGGPDLGWGEVAALGASAARRALAAALTGMLLDGEITRDRAQQLARMVLRENAAGLYHIQ